MFALSYTLNTKAVAAILSGIIILSVVFFFFNVSYPSGPFSITPPPVKNPNVTKVPLGYLFNPQYIEPKGLQNLSFGTNSSAVQNFTLEKNGTTIITGVLTNKSSGSVIKITDLFVFAAPVFTKVTVGMNGTYRVTVLIYGKMNLTFVVPGYNKQVIPLDLKGGTQTLDLAMVPENKLTWSGYTNSSSGNTAGNITVQVSGILDQNTAFTSSAYGQFSIKLYRDSFQLTVLNSAYNSLPVPREVDLGSNLTMNITVTPNQYLYNITGTVYNKANGTVVPDALVHNQQTNQQVYSSKTGTYSIGVLAGSNRLITTHSGFFTNVSYFDASNAYYGTPIHNIYMEPYNPFVSNNTGYLGNGTSAPPLLNNTSTVNLSNPGNYILKGTILINGTSNPVSGASLEFLVNMNGSIYGNRVITNSTGHYNTSFLYTGKYRILVESVFYDNKTIDVSITKKINYYNFTLTPKTGKTVNVTGYVLDSRNLLPIMNASVSSILYSNKLVAATTFTNQTGYFSMTLIEGNYTFTASAYGFKPNSTGVINMNVSRNIQILLTPVSTFPVGSTPCLFALGNTPNYGLPDLTPAQIVRDVNISGTISTSTVYNLTVHLNASSGISLQNTPFVLYINIYGQIYYYLGATNSSGFGYLPCLNGGSYEMLAETFYDRGTTSNITVTSNMTTWLNLTTLTQYSGTLFMQNSFNWTHGLGANVPYSKFSLTNSILPVNLLFTSLINSTKVSFMGYNGTFNFTYNNSHFIVNSFSIPFSGFSISRTVSLIAFEVILTGNTTSEWIYSITGIVQPTSVFSGLHVFDFMAHTGSFTASANLFGYSSFMKNKTVKVTALQPQKYLYFNESTEISNLSWNGGFPSGNNVDMNYSGSIPLNALIFKGLLPYTAPLNSTIYINGTLQGALLSQGNNQTTFTLNQYYQASGYVKVEISIPPNSNGGFSGGLGSLEIFYHTIQLV